MAAGGRIGPHRLASSRHSLVAPVVHAWEDSLRERSVPRESSAARRCRSMPGTRSDDRRKPCSATWSPTRCSGHAQRCRHAECGHPAARRRDQAGPDQQLSARVDLPVSDETRVISFELTGARLRRCSSTAWPTVAREGTVPPGVGRGIHLRPGCHVGPADRRKTQSIQGGGPIRPPTHWRWRFRYIRRVREETDTRCPRRKRDATTGHRRHARWTCSAYIADSMGGTVVDSRRTGGSRRRRKHKSRLSVNSPGPEP